MCVLFAIGFWAQSLQFYIFWNLVNKNRNYLSRVVKKKKKKSFTTPSSPCLLNGTSKKFEAKELKSLFNILFLQLSFKSCICTSAPAWTHPRVISHIL